MVLALAKVFSFSPLNYNSQVPSSSLGHLRPVFQDRGAGKIGPINSATVYLESWLTLHEFFRQMQLLYVCLFIFDCSRLQSKVVLLGCVF